MSSTKSWMVFRTILQAALGVTIIGAGFSGPGEAPTITNPQNGTKTDQAWITVEGKAKPSMPVLVYNNGQYLGRSESDATGKWKTQFSFTSGKHKLTTRYEFPNGTSGSDSKPISFEVTDILAPLDRKLKVTNLNDGDEVKAGTFRLRGTTAPERRIQLNLDGKSFRKVADAEGNFQFNLKLLKGSRKLTLSTLIEPKESVTLDIIVR